MVMNIDIAAVSHRGAVRPANEDSAGIAGWTLTAEEPTVVAMTVEVSVAIDLLVADGLGGHRGGARASREVVSAYFRAAGEGADVAASIIAADDAVHAVADADPQLRGMGSTLVGVRVEPDGRLIVFNVGDSRAYRIVGGFLGQLSEDDRTEGARTSVTQVLGGERRVAIEPHVFETTLSPGEILLLCSDGLHDVLDDDQIAAPVTRPLAAAAATLLATALEAGAPDNVTIVLLAVAAAEPSLPHPEDDGSDNG